MKVRKRQKTAPSRCKAVTNEEKQSRKCRKSERTNGIFATVDMNDKCPRILHLLEMLNGECRTYKVAAAQEVSAHAKIGIYCHDCSCRLTEFEGTYCNRVLLDSWHAKSHKCSKKRFDPKNKANQHVMKGKNSEAAEHLWTRMNKFSAMTRGMTRSRFRFFLKQYCLWRNSFLLRGMRAGASPLKSRKNLARKNQRGKNRKAP